MRKKYILKWATVIFTVAFLIFLTSITLKEHKVEAVTLSNFSKTAQDLIQQYNIPLSNYDGYILNEDFLLRMGIVVYGSPANVPGNELKNGQYRFYGYTADGNKYANYAFPNDLDVTGSVAKNWISQPWNTSTGRAKGILQPSYLWSPKGINYVVTQLNTMLDPYDPNNQKNPPTGKTWLQSYNELTGSNWTGNTLVNYVIINNFASNFGPGSATMWNLSKNGSWWYQTFVIPPRISISNNGGSNTPTQCTNNCGPTKTSSIVHTEYWDGKAANYYDYFSLEIVSLSPAMLKAGFGFSFSIKTHYSNEWDVNAKGPNKVTVYFPNADPYAPIQIDLEPVNPVGSWENTWVLPEVYVEKFSGNIFYNQNDVKRDLNDELLSGGRKWYTPWKQKDGPYNFRVEATGVGPNNLNDCKCNCVIVNGSPFTEYFPRLVSPSNPFPTHVVGKNWQGNEYILSNLIDWYGQKEDKSSVDRPIDQNSWSN